MLIKGKKSLQALGAEVSTSLQRGQVVAAVPSPRRGRAALWTRARPCRQPRLCPLRDPSNTRLTAPPLASEGQGQSLASAHPPPPRSYSLSSPPVPWAATEDTYLLRPSPGSAQGLPKTGASGRARTHYSRTTPSACAVSKDLLG